MLGDDGHRPDARRRARDRARGRDPAGPRRASCAAHGLPRLGGAPPRRPAGRRRRRRPDQPHEEQRELAEQLDESLEPDNLAPAARRGPLRAACAEPSVDPPRGPLRARAGRAGPRRADRAGARTGSRRSAGRATSSTRSTAARASCRSWASSRPRPASGLVEVSSTEVPDDWADRWRDFHKPLLVGERLWLRPSWEPPREGAIDLVVDPGQAFGTGAHPTTRLCLELLLELADGGRGRAGR